MALTIKGITGAGIKLHTVSSVPPALPATLTANSAHVTYPTSNTWSTTHQSASVTYSNGNLTAAGGGSGHCAIASNGFSSGYRYWEVTTGVTSTNCMIGFALTTINVDANIFFAQTANSAFSYYGNGGGIYNGNSAISSTGTPISAPTTGTVISIVVNLVDNTSTWYVNGTKTVTVSVPSGHTWYPSVGDGSGSDNWHLTANFGNTSLTYLPPTGYTSGI